MKITAAKLEKLGFEIETDEEEDTYLVKKIGKSLHLSTECFTGPSDVINHFYLEFDGDVIEELVISDIEVIKSMLKGLNNE